MFPLSIKLRKQEPFIKTSRGALYRNGRNTVLTRKISSSHPDSPRAALSAARAVYFTNQPIPQFLPSAFSLLSINDPGEIHQFSTWRRCSESSADPDSLGSGWSDRAR